jgi:hypothetical protein
MIRALFGLLLGLSPAAAWGQFPMNAPFPQAPNLAAYQQAYQQPFYASQGFPAAAPYGYGLYGGYGAYGFAARGYYPPNPFGNMNWLPPTFSSPYYLTPSREKYLGLVRQKDQATYTELQLQVYPRVRLK